MSSSEEKNKKLASLISNPIGYKEWVNNLYTTFPEFKESKYDLAEGRENFDIAKRFCDFLKDYLENNSHKDSDPFIEKTADFLDTLYSFGDEYTKGFLCFDIFDELSADSENDFFLNLVSPVTRNAFRPFFERLGYIITPEVREKYKQIPLIYPAYVSRKKDYYSVEDFSSFGWLSHYLAEVNDREADLTKEGIRFFKEVYGFERIAKMLYDDGWYAEEFRSPQEILEWWQRGEQWSENYG